MHTQATHSGQSVSKTHSPVQWPLQGFPPSGTFRRHSFWLPARGTLGNSAQSDAHAAQRRACRGSNGDIRTGPVFSGRAGIWPPSPHHLLRPQALFPRRHRARLCLRVRHTQPGDTTGHCWPEGPCPPLQRPRDPHRAPGQASKKPVLPRGRGATRVGERWTGRLDSA